MTDLPPSSAESVLREHVAYLRDQLAGKDRWQDAELARLREEVKGYAALVTKNQELRIELARATRDVLRLNKDNADEVDASWTDAWDELADGK
jgi:hypothetical protein